MESPLSLDSINISVKDSGCQVELGQVRSSRQVRSALLGLTTCDLQLRKIITSSSELCLRCSWIYGKPIESRFQPCLCGGNWVLELAVRVRSARTGRVG